MNDILSLLPEKLNHQILAQYNHVYRVNQRQGNASTKDRSQIRGTTKKVYKQKGTGNARHGSKKAPIYVGGGVVGGPKPKDYTLKMTKAHTVLAFKNALLAAMQMEKVKEIQMPIDFSGGTKEFLSFLQSNNVPHKTFMFYCTKEELSETILRAVRNVRYVRIIDIAHASTHDLMRAHVIGITSQAIHQLKTRLTI